MQTTMYKKGGKERFKKRSKMCSLEAAGDEGSRQTGHQWWEMGTDEGAVSFYDGKSIMNNFVSMVFK